MNVVCSEEQEHHHHDHHHYRPILSVDMIRDIVISCKPIYKDINEEKMVHNMINELSMEELEIAARSSYGYYILSKTNRICSNRSRSSSSSSGGGGVEEELKTTTTTTSPYHDIDQDIARINMASKEAQRHLMGEHYKYNKAKQRFHNIIQSRKEHNIDLLRECFYDNDNNNNNSIFHIEYNDKISMEMKRNMREMIQKELECQLTIVRGHDINHFPISYKGQRITDYFDEAGFLMTHLYTTERCIAVSEVLTHGKHQKISAIADYTTTTTTMPSSSENSRQLNTKTYSIPKRTSLRLLKIVGQIYAERLHKKIILEPPMWVRILFGIVSKFMPTSTLEKIIILNSSTTTTTRSGNNTNDDIIIEQEMKRRESVVKTIVDIQQAIPALLPNGKLTSKFNIHQYLYDVPFHILYDEYYHQ